MKTQIELYHRPIDVGACYSWTLDAASGGINIFSGIVRDNTKGRKTLRLEYEAYEPMALAEMGKIARTCAEKWPDMNALLIHHRLGSLQIGEAAVLIAVAAPHRLTTFDACRFIIDTLKQTVPIWKKEFFEDGESWVSAFP